MGERAARPVGRRAWSVWSGVTGWKWTCRSRGHVEVRGQTRKPWQRNQRAEEEPETDRIVHLLVRTPERLGTVPLLLHLALPSLPRLPPLPEPLQLAEPAVLLPQRVQLLRRKPEESERVPRGSAFARIDAEPLVREREREGPSVREVPPEGEDDLARGGGARAGARRGGDGLDEGAGFVVEGVDVQVEFGEEGGGGVPGGQGRAGGRGRVGDGERAGEESADREQVRICEAHSAGCKVRSDASFAAMLDPNSLGERGGDLAGHLDGSGPERLRPDRSLPPRHDRLGEEHEDAARAAEGLGGRVDGFVMGGDRGGRDRVGDFVRAEGGDEGGSLVREAEGVREEGAGQFGVAAGQRAGRQFTERTLSFEATYREGRATRCRPFLRGDEERDILHSKKTAGGGGQGRRGAPSQGASRTRVGRKDEVVCVYASEDCDEVGEVFLEGLRAGESSDEVGMAWRWQEVETDPG